LSGLILYVCRGVSVLSLWYHEGFEGYQQQIDGFCVWQYITVRIISLSSTISLLRLQHYRWLDETPTGRIITRCTQDIRAIDGPVPQTFVWLLDLGSGMVTKLGAIVLFTPLFLVPGAGVAIFGLYLGNLYLKAQLSVKRETRYVQEV